MKISISTVLDFVALALIPLLAVVMININLKTQAARNFHALAVDEIENCNFSDDVISGLIEEANKKGYELSIDKYNINDSKLAEVTLNYTYSVPLLDIVNKPQTIRGTAR